MILCLTKHKSITPQWVSIMVPASSENWLSFVGLRPSVEKNVCFVSAGWLVLGRVDVAFAGVTLEHFSGQPLLLHRGWYLQINQK